MALIHVSHPHVLLFMLLVIFMCFGMYFMSELQQIHNLPYSFLSPKNSPRETGKLDRFGNHVMRFEASTSVSVTKFPHIESNTREEPGRFDNF